MFTQTERDNGHRYYTAPHGEFQSLLAPYEAVTEHFAPQQFANLPKSIAMTLTDSLAICSNYCWLLLRSFSSSRNRQRI
jgi:hypothetical protein